MPRRPRFGSRQLFAMASLGTHSAHRSFPTAAPEASDHPRSSNGDGFCSPSHRTARRSGSETRRAPMGCNACSQAVQQAAANGAPDHDLRPTRRRCVGVFIEIRFCPHACRTVGAIEGWHRRRAERDLCALSDRMLADIGLTRSEIPSAVRGERSAIPDPPAFVARGRIMNLPTLPRACNRHPLLGCGRQAMAQADIGCLPAFRRQGHEPHRYGRGRALAGRCAVLDGG